MDECIYCVVGEWEGGVSNLSTCSLQYIAYSIINVIKSIISYWKVICYNSMSEHTGSARDWLFKMWNSLDDCMRCTGMTLNRIQILAGGDSSFGHLDAW